MVKATPPPPCPKCGDSTWLGPTWMSAENTQRYHETNTLRWECSTCRYKKHTPPLDAAE